MRSEEWVHACKWFYVHFVQQRVYVQWLLAKCTYLKTVVNGTSWKKGQRVCVGRSDWILCVSVTICLNNWTYYIDLNSCEKFLARHDVSPDCVPFVGLMKINMKISQQTPSQRNKKTTKQLVFADKIFSRSNLLYVRSYISQSDLEEPYVREWRK